MLKASFNCGPCGVVVIGGDYDGNLVANFEAEVSNGCVKNLELFAVNFDKVLVIVASKRTNNSFAFDWADLLVHELAAFANCELKDVALDEL